jgi:small subunit ribosomal protein S6
MAGFYDLVLLLDPNVPDDRHAEILREVEGMVGQGGEIVGSHDWGDRRMAYEIDHRGDAVYHLFQINAERELLERLNRSLRIMEGVLRFRIIKQKPGAPLPPPPAGRVTEAPRRREEEPSEGRVAARSTADA